MFELKPIHKEAVAAAMERAKRYRLLNEPVEAESICQDILAVDPGNQEALATMLLALTDEFDFRLSAAFGEATKVLEQFTDDYSKVYFEGILCERRAKAHFKRGGPGAAFLAYEWLTKAMSLFEKAEELRHPENDEAILRYNTCARILNRHPEIKPAPQDDAAPMLE
jgi:hypothetical protein